MLDQFSATIEKIYAAATDGSRWEEALRAVEDFTGSTGAVLNLVPKTDAAVPAVLAGSFSRSDCDDYAANYMWRCPRIKFGSSHLDLPIHYDSMFISETEMDRDATYAWYGSHGLRYYVAGWLGESDSHRAYMSLQRSRRQGHVDAPDVEQFGLLLKPMSQALSLSVKLGTLHRRTALSSELLDALPDAIFVLDAQAHVFMANSAARAILTDDDGLALLEGRLTCRNANSQRRLDEKLKSLLTGASEQQGGGWVRMDRPSGRPSYVGFVAKLGETTGIFGSAEPSVAVIVNNPLGRVVAAEAALVDLYGLTQAEACLATALSGGHSVESAAALLRMRPATARTHLKHVFRKLGVNRQQDLVRLVYTLPTVSSLV